MRFWAVVDDDEAIELHVRREDAESFLEDVRADDQELPATLRLEPVDLQFPTRADLYITNTSVRRSWTTVDRPAIRRPGGGRLWISCGIEACSLFS